MSAPIKNTLRFLPQGRFFVAEWRGVALILVVGIGIINRYQEITALCVLVLKVAAVVSAQANGESLNATNALTSEEAHFVFSGTSQANAVVPLSDSEMASTSGNALCIFVWNNGNVYVRCDPPNNISYSGH